jgi:hypothetical protein
MKNKLLKGLVASFALTVSGLVSAGTIDITETFNEFGSRATDQNGFNWTFDGLDEPPLFGLASFDVNWERIDFDHGSEYMDIFVEGSLLGRIGTQNATCTSTSGFRADCNGSASFNLNIQNFLVDNKLELTSIQSGVDSSGGPANNSAFGFISVNLSYEFLETPNLSKPVPEPSTLAVFALGLLGFASRQFKNKA